VLELEEREGVLAAAVVAEYRSAVAGEPGDGSNTLVGFTSRASRSAILLSRKQLLSRAACSRSWKRLTSWVSSRIRCFNVVFSDQTLNAVLGQVGFQVADFADEFTDCAALREDFVVGRLETVFGVERAFTP